jgi:ligand-binding sensor domain-containing protein
LKIKIWLAYLAFFLAHQVFGQLRDTLLYSMASSPFYYNVLKGGDGKIYAGTSEGVYLFDGATPSKLDDRIGYLTLDKKENPVIDPNGIKYHNQTTYSHMLPFATESRDEYHAGTEDFFYITSGGKMHIYEILPFNHNYRNHSVRTASRNFVGTYSGIYYRGIKIGPDMRFPKFTDGRIRELNGKAFICYSSLVIADLQKGDSLPVCRLEMPKGFNFEWVSDVMYSSYHKQYFVSAKTDLASINESLTEAHSLYRPQDKDAEVTLLGENRGALYFSAGRKFMSITPATQKTKEIYTLPAPILDGYIGNLSNYLLSNEGLFTVNADGTFKQLATLKKAHTLQHLGGSDFVIATDAGLFRYDAASNKMSELIKGVEFNRRGLYLQGDSLFAGSIDGLYVLDVRHLEQLAERTMKMAGGKTQIPVFLVLLIAGLGLFVAALSYLLYRSRLRLKFIEEELPASDVPKTTREDIETFIKENLAQASLKSISERFKTNHAVIYSILDPEKPGAFINRLRMEQVKKLRKAGKSAAEISQLTGFSEYYVRKVWNK